MTLEVRISIDQSCTYKGLDSILPALTPPPGHCSDSAMCHIHCDYGYKKDPKNCDICECQPAPTCETPVCAMFCPNGLEVDAQGCEVCLCREAAQQGNSPVSGKSH